MVEVTVVLAIIGIMLAVVIPNLPAVKRRIQLNESVRELISDLRYVQQLTITEQQNYCLKIFSEEKKYQTLRCQEGVVTKEKFLPAEIISINAEGFSDNKVEFNPYGAAKESGQILFQGTGGLKIIDIKISGFVRTID